MSQLRTSEGELLHLSVHVELKRLEGLLHTLDALPFPVNPEIVHAAAQTQTVDVRFPAYERRMPGVIISLEQAGFTRNLLSVRAALSA
jgi:hypothetical protein